MTPGAPAAPQRHSFYLQVIFPNYFPVGYQAFDVYSSLGLPARSRTTCLKRKTAAIMAANQIADTSLPHDWPDLFLPFFPQQTPSPTTQRDMESSAQTPAAQGVPQPPSTEMTEAIKSPSKEVIPLNALLVEPIPLAFLETVAPDNAFVTMNTRAATLLFKVKCLFPPQPLPPRNYRYVELARSKTLTTTVSRLLPYFW